MDYKTKLEEAKTAYPFKKWHSYEAHGLEQYTAENCQEATQIFDTLIADLVTLGESASEEEKLQKFQAAVEALNDLNDETGIIETGEREELCALLDLIGTKAGIDPVRDSSGESIASQWRDW